MKELLSWALAIIVIGVLSVGLYETRSSLRDTRTALAAQTVVVEDLRASQAKVSAAVQALAKKSQVTRVEVRDALAKEPSYRDTAVPAGVADGLCKRLKCAK